MKEIHHKGQLSDNGLKENQTENKFYVYALVCPIDNIVRYVGATINLDLRFKQHIKELNSNSRKTEWIKFLSENNMFPTMKVLAILNTELNCRESESFFISKYRKTIYNSSSPRPYKINPIIKENQKVIIAHIPFNRDTHDKIKNEAKELGLTVSAYIRMLVLKDTSK